MSGELENPEKREPGGRRNNGRTAEEDGRVFGIIEDWSTAALDHEVLYNIECEGVAAL